MYNLILPTNSAIELKQICTTFNIEEKTALFLGIETFYRTQNIDNDNNFEENNWLKDEKFKIKFENNLLIQASEILFPDNIKKYLIDLLNHTNMPLSSIITVSIRSLYVLSENIQKKTPQPASN